MKLLKLSEDEVLAALLSAFGPPQPGAVRGAWQKSEVFGKAAPPTKDLWKLVVDADFRCTKCTSQRRLTFDHLDGNAKNHSLTNLRVLCMACNRAKARKGLRQPNKGLLVYRAVMELWGEGKREFTNAEVASRATVDKVAGETYLVKFLKVRLTNTATAADLLAEDLAADDEIAAEEPAGSDGYGD